MEQMGTFMENMQKVLYGKQYCDIDHSDLCITQDKKNRAKKPYDEQGNRKKIAANRKTKQTKRNRR